MTRCQVTVERWQRNHGAELVERLTLPDDTWRERIATGVMALLLVLAGSVLIWSCS